MSDPAFTRLRVSPDISLNVATAGDQRSPAVMMLHGFPESHRTWRAIAPKLEDRFYLVMPDQRGFAGSARPQDEKAYETDKLVEDIFELADSLGLETFALVGHDWGGAIAWTAALRRPERLSRLAIINAPHPWVFQKSLIEDAEQRAASQYISAFRTTGFEEAVEAIGYKAFFEKSFSRHVDLSQIPETEKQQYIAEWSQPGGLTAMLNWYRASKLIVPPPGVTIPVPDWLLKAFPKIEVPTLVIWGMRDAALLPVQLDGLDELVEDLRIVRLPDAGHFAPWEAPDEVAAALEPFLAEDMTATAPAA
jgi:pimeloyl-ACP methyl ester carboxylesterase